MSKGYASLKNKEDLRLITTSCRIKGSEEVGSLWDPNGVDVLYTGVMPKWLDYGALTVTEKLQYYELKESELQEINGFIYMLKLQSTLSGMFALSIIPHKEEDVESEYEAQIKECNLVHKFQDSWR